MKAGNLLVSSAQIHQMAVPERAEKAARVASILRPVLENVAEDYYQQVNKGFKAWQVRI